MLCNVTAYRRQLESKEFDVILLMIHRVRLRKDDKSDASLKRLAQSGGKLQRELGKHDFVSHFKT